MKRLQEIRQALGSEAVLTVVVADTDDGAALFSELWCTLEVFEQRFSRFRSDSELSALNQHHGEWYKVSAEMILMLKTCREYAQKTEGLFNPLILPALQKAGYKTSWPQPDLALSADLDVSDRAIHVATDIEVNVDRVRIPKNAALDFGGIGKGYALDLLGAQLRAKGVEDFWLSLGGDILSHGHDLDGQNWEVGIASAKNAARLVKTIHNKDGAFLAIASSGVTKRRGTNWHHIIDPRTGVSSTSNVLVATVTSTSATTADIFAKCLVIDPDVSFIKVGSPECPEVELQYA